jgi:hypothetical protein
VAVTAAAVTIKTLNKVITAQSEGVNMKYCATKHQNYIYSMAAIC